MGVRVLTFLLFLSFNNVYGQFNSEVKIGSISNHNITSNMEQATTLIIDEINSAFAKNTVPKNPDNSLIETSAFNNILSLWEVSHFKITQTQLVLNGLYLQNGTYQIRNIPVYFNDENNEAQEREVAFTFDKDGKMTDCFLCLEMNTYSSLRNENNPVTELRRRETILDFLEKFRTAYNIKDEEFIKKVFGENALIIVGKIIKESSNQPNEGMTINTLPKEQVKYIRVSKKEYLNNLANAFKANQYIKIDFDSIEIVQSKQHPEVYGVTLWQSWKSSKYSDLGWLFLMIDFKDEDTPKIYVRTWQPGFLNGKPFSRDEVFRLSNFNFERD